MVSNCGLIHLIGNIVYIFLFVGLGPAELLLKAILTAKTILFIS